MKTIPRYISLFIDWCYGLIPPLRKVMPLQTFRYVACGGLNMLLSLGMYELFYRFVFRFEEFRVAFVTISPHVAALCSVFPINLLIGFYLNRNVTFKLSPLNTKTQLARYTISNIGSLGVQYIFLKLLVESVGLYGTLGQAIASVMTVFIYSYPMQKYFSFRGCEDK